MHSESIITGRRMYLDNNVWLVMIVTSILCLGLVGYKFISKEPCTPFTLGVTGAKDDKGVYELGQPLIFRASLATDKEIVWSFGDKTELQSSTNGMVRHTFTKEGIFNVTALINGRCTGDDLRLHIKKGDLSIEKLNIKTPRILGNLNPIAGKAQTYISDVIGTDYEWKILDKTAFPTINKQSASFTFPTAGLYRLQLTVDHDRNNKRATIEINVFEDLAKVNNVSKAPPIFIPPPPKKQAPKQEPKPEQKPEIKPEIKPETPAPNAGSPSPSAPAARKILIIRNEGFKTKLQGVVDGQNDVQDFNTYLQEGGDTKLLVNEKWMSLKQLCDQIRGKKIIIEEVEIIRAEDNQIQRIKIKYKKKGFNPFG